MKRAIGFGLILALFLGIPLFIRGRDEAGLVWGTPRIHGGDEPHYLLMLNSLIEDGGLELSNHYRSVLTGSREAGDAYRGVIIDHHVSYYIDDRYYYWADLFGPLWSYGPDGSLQPQVREGVAPELARTAEELPEYSSHPPGLAILVAPLALPFRGTWHVECIAVLSSALAVFLLAFVMRALFGFVIGQGIAADLLALGCVLGTPLWHYSRTFFSEPVLALLAAAAYLLWLKQRWHILAGLCIAAGMLVKPPFALMALPIAIYLLVRERNLRALAAFALPILSATAALLVMNDQMFGSFAHSSMPFRFGNPWKGAMGLLLSRTHGLLRVSPLCIFAAAGWFRGERKIQLICAALAAALYFLLMAAWQDWAGGYCYGPRLILPALPLLNLGLGRIAKEAKPAWRWGLVAAGIVSVALNFLPAVFPASYFSDSPR